MEKTFEMHTKRVISYLQAVKQNSRLVAYRDEKFIDGERVSVSEGLAHIQDIQSIGKNQPVKEYTKKYVRNNSKDKKGVQMARRTHFREALRKTGMGGVKWETLGIVNNPYTVIETNGMLDMDNPGEYEIFYFEFSSFLVEGLDEKPVPQAMRFDYMASNGQLDDGLYDLKKLLKAIQDRTDLEWLNREGKAKISDIPSYNWDEHRSSQLEFRWIPTDEDYALLEYDTVTGRRWTRNAEVMEKVFGLNLTDYQTVRSEEDEDC